VPKRDSAPIGAPCWIDLMTSDTAKSRKFYGDLFGWTSEDAGEEYGGYINFHKDGVPVAGLMQSTPDMGVANVWSVYLATDDAEKTVEAAVANGGQVIVPAMAVLELGSMAVITDAGQAAVGMWQPGLHKGMGIIGEPNAPSWFELHTRDYEASVRFYRDVFKWDTHEVSNTPELRYTTLGEGENQQAGIMDASAFLPSGVPAHWSIYFGVENADAALAKIKKLGGATVLPAEDTPYGRLATASDATGSVFKLHQPL
jgi:predicted enzyme related to lactoylglutathione lyase